MPSFESSDPSNAPGHTRADSAAPEHLASLDVLRTLAITAVFVMHFAVSLEGLTGTVAQSLLQSRLVRLGWAGVDLFFVLSGYLIGRQLWSEVLSTGSIDIRAFVLRRGFRIWPLYFAFAVATPITTPTPTYRIGDWLFLSNYLGGRVEGGWSLSTEEQFYLLAPLAILLFVRYVSRSARAVVPSVALLIALIALTRWQAASELTAAGVALPDIRQRLHYPIHLHCEGLLIGLAIARFSMPGHTWIGHGLSRWRVLGLTCAIAVIGATLYAVEGTTFVFTSLGLIFGAALITALATPATVVPAWAARAFGQAARLSFGVYLNHFSVLRFIAVPGITAFQRFGLSENQAVVAAFALSAVISLSAAEVLYRLIERPALRVRSRVLRRLARRAPRDAASAEGALAG